MNVFVIGATGFLGGGAARALHEAGHRVVANARTDEAAERMTSLGYAVARCDVTAPESLVEPARASDGVIYAVALYGDEADFIDGNALTALADALAGSGKPLVYTSGVWYYGPTGDRVADESTPPNPPPTTLSRPRLEGIVLSAASRGVRSVVIRPGDVFGEGKGLPAMFVQSATESGAARTIGDGANRWPVVHVDDLGRLYALALEKAGPGDAFNATDDTAFTQLEIAQAASRGAGRAGATSVWAVEDAAAAMGPWIANLAMDQRVTSARARARLGWSPREATIVDDLERGSYAATVAR